MYYIPTTDREFAWPGSPIWLLGKQASTSQNAMRTKGGDVTRRKFKQRIIYAIQFGGDVVCRLAEQNLCFRKAPPADWKVVKRLTVSIFQNIVKNRKAPGRVNNRVQKQIFVHSSCVHAIACRTDEDKWQTTDFSNFQLNIVMENGKQTWRDNDTTDTSQADALR